MAKRLTEEEKLRRETEKQQKRDAVETERRLKREAYAAKQLAWDKKRKILEKEYNDENDKRLSFGICSAIFYPAYGETKPMFQIRNKQDFELLYENSKKNFNPNVKRNEEELEKIKYYNDCKHSVLKYTEYVIKQVSDAGGVLPLSKTCDFVHVMFENKLGFDDRFIHIFYRQKNAINLTKEYPPSVIETFKNNGRCKAVVYCYFLGETRNVIFEKYKKPAKKNKKKYDDIDDYDFEEVYYMNNKHSYRRGKNKYW